MLMCRECGHVFEMPGRHLDNSDSFEFSSLWEREGCPHCGGNFCEAKQCSQCGEYITPEQARFGLCADCEIRADARFKELMAKNFTPNEIDYLNNQYDGECFPGGCDDAEATQPTES